MNKKKQVKRFRVKVGETYCSLSKKFHDLGVIIPDAASRDEAHIFVTLVAANNAIQRRYEARNIVMAGMYPDLPMFKPLMFDLVPVVEEFLTDEE